MFFLTQENVEYLLKGKYFGTYSNFVFLFHKSYIRIYQQALLYNPNNLGLIKSIHAAKQSNKTKLYMLTFSMV